MPPNEHLHSRFQSTAVDTVRG